MMLRVMLAQLVLVLLLVLLVLLLLLVLVLLLLLVLLLVFQAQLLQVVVLGLAAQVFRGSPPSWKTLLAYMIFRSLTRGYPHACGYVGFGR